MLSRWTTRLARASSMPCSSEAPIVVGDDGYLGLLDRVHAHGQITDKERRERRLLHFTIRRAGAAAA
jgi:hypothetical protein